jgi:2-oxoglutarate dehydrogenase E2 component (dihydrolipoamide succinyltransferase)
MAVELKVPAVGESITEVLIAVWHKQAGDTVAVDETVAELESDKATLELPAPAAGVITQLLKQQGEMAQVGEVIGYIEAAGTVAATVSTASAAAVSAVPVVPLPRATPKIMPAAARLLAAAGLSAELISGSGRDGTILKEDVLNYREQPTSPPAPLPAAPPAAPVPAPSVVSAPAAVVVAPSVSSSPLKPAGQAGGEEAVPMSPMRKRIAERLLEAQSHMALLTTFNEVDMSNVIALRQEYQERFQQRYEIKLGFMSFFVKAVIEALKLVPQVNAEIRGTDIIYKNHYDLGIAVGGGKGLIVPVLRDADHLSFAQVEQAIADFGQRAKTNKIELEELKGGTFTISNGGVYGSLLSTPIVNPPQSGVLGLHAIQERPVALAGQVVIRPMMYIALTYDHRLIDGRESVLFLKRIKELIEEPARLLLEV